MTPPENVIIIGAGPAGIAAAIQLKRYGLEPVLLEKNEAGGLLVNANLVENYPGFPQGISGKDLVALFQDQLENAGVTITREEVVRLDYDKHFIVHTSKRTLHSRIAVIASGTRPRTADIAIEVPDRVFYEVAPLANISGKKVVIVGAGDAAFDYALNLSRRNDITILNKSDTLKCLPLLWERAKRTPSIAYQENARVASIKRAPGGISVSCQNHRGAWELRADYAIFAIGRIAQLGYLSGNLTKRIPELERSGLLYLAGDVKNDIYRQTSIAVGNGVHAAMRIYSKLQGSD